MRLFRGDDGESKSNTRKLDLSKRGSPPPGYQKPAPTTPPTAANPEDLDRHGFLAKAAMDIAAQGAKYQGGSGATADPFDSPPTVGD